MVHRHPLQNRAISPKMRVITRHSKLLYFLKHLPRWQFWSLSAIVAIEAAIKGSGRGCWDGRTMSARGERSAEITRRHAGGPRAAGPRGSGSGRIRQS